MKIPKATKSRAYAFLNLLVILFATGLVSSCEWIARYRCEWYIMPDIKNKELVEPGWASVCVSNFEINKRRCFLQMPIEEAEKVYGKKFRFVDIEVKEKEFPRTITSYTSCEAPSTTP